jgi:hypothetical protein
MPNPTANPHGQSVNEATKGRLTNWDPRGSCRGRPALRAICVVASIAVSVAVGEVWMTGRIEGDGGCAGDVAGIDGLDAPAISRTDSGLHVICLCLGAQGVRVGVTLRLDPNVLWRRAGLVRTLASPESGVVPAAADDAEHTNFDGGPTIRRYRGAQPTGLDALQIEIIRSVRLDCTPPNSICSSLGPGLVSLLARQQRRVQS